MSRRQQRTRAKAIRHAKAGSVARKAGPGAAAAAIVLAGPLAAEAGELDTIELVRDIRQTPSIASSSDPSRLTDVNGTLFFTANDGTNGIELWKSDGSTATQVADIRPGSASSYPRFLTNVNGTLFFTANNGSNGQELWKSDGTSATQVADIRPVFSSYPEHLTNVNGTLFFNADDGSNGFELWKSDGSTATLVADINPGAGGASSNPTYLTNVNGSLFFSADNGSNGYELWKSDGSTATQVANIRPAGASSSPYYLTNVNGTLFFSADNGSDGRELWKSDGSTATQVANIRPAGLSSYPRYLTNANGTLFFSADNGTSGYELWKSDGSSATQVANINPGAGSSSPEYLTNVNGTLFFRATDGASGVELWKSDGSTATQVANISPAAGHSHPSDLTNVNGTLFFGADDGSSGRELWKSDGSTATLVADINPGGASSNSPTNLTNVAGTLFFQATDVTHGYELWRAADTTAPETTINSGPADGATITTNSATFAFSGTPGDTARLQCKLDAGAFADCTSPHTFLNLTDGPHTASFRAVDEFGNQDASPASRTFTVDTIAPETTIDSGPAEGSTITTDSATFAFSGTAGDTAKTQCSLDSGAFADCTSPHTFTNLTDGPHTVSFRAEDAVGYQDASPASRTFSVDTTAPETTITSGPAEGSTITTDSATFAFQGTAGDTAKIQCRLDSGTFADCTSPHTFAGLAEGAHTAAFRAEDEFGNQDASLATRTFTVDTPEAPTPNPPGPDPPANDFTLPRKGKANLKKGSLTLTIELPGPGTLEAEQASAAARALRAAKTLVNPVAKPVEAAGPIKIKIKLSKTGLKALEKALAKAEARGKDVGTLKVPIAFTFTPTGGEANTETRVYKLKLG